MLLVLASCGKKEKEFDATGTFEATEVTVSAKSTGELEMPRGRPLRQASRWATSTLPNSP